MLYFARYSVCEKKIINEKREEKHINQKEKKLMY